MNKVSRKFLLKRFSLYLRPYIWINVLILTLLLIESIGSLATPYVLKIIIDDIFPHHDFGKLIGILAFLITVYLIRISCSVLIETLYSKFSQQVVSQIRQDILCNLLLRPVTFFKNLDSGQVLYLVINDVENIQSAVSSLLLNFIDNFLTVVGILVMLAILNFKLTAISLLVLPFLFFSIKKFTPHLQASFRRIQELEGLQNNFFLEKIRNIRVIKSYNTFGYEKTKLSQLQKDINKSRFKNTLLNALNSNITTFFIAIGPVIVLLFGGKDVLKGSMTVGALIAFIQYLNRLFTPTISMMNSYSQFNKALISMERVSEYLDLQQKRTISESVKIPDFKFVKLNNVSLALSGKKVLNEVTLIFERGKMYSLTGPSGSGKSTVINLLCGFYEPDQGKICIDDGTALSSIQDWSSAIGLVEKENQLFNGQIRDNITYGNPNRGEADILRCVMDAQLVQIIAGLPNGMNTVINETGTYLSDGQKQRISIARMLLKAPPIIILDEATSSLDTDLEKLIITRLKKANPNSIIILITHKRSLIKETDYYYELRDGALVKKGDSELFTYDVEPV